MVSIGKWGNPDGIFGGFTVNPEDYHIRRLVEMKPGVTPDGGTIDTWELVDQVIDRLEVDVFLTDDAYTTGTRDAHWIPNTEEMLEIDEIQITLINKDNIEMTMIPTELNEIKILSPQDPSFVLLDAQASVKSNVRTNKGSGFVFYALPEEGEPIELATFSIKPFSETLTMDTLYNVSYKETYFTAEGRGKEGYKLALKATYADENNTVYIGDKTLCFVDTTDAENHKYIEKFGVKAYGTIRPGDDFLLQFGLASDIGKPGVAEEGQFVAVYDKKLLWRVNLYIDEGDNDWNDLNPWNQPDSNLPHYNEWQDAGSDVLGGQMEIKPWRHPQGDFYWWTDIKNGNWFHWSIDSQIVTNSVSYGGPVDPGYNGTGDECPEYQRKLGEQITALETAGKINPPGSWADYENSSYVPSVGFYNLMQRDTNWVIFGKFTSVEFQNQILGNINNENDKTFVESMYKEKDGMYYLRNFVPEEAKEPISEEDRKRLTTIIDGIGYTHPVINGIRDMRLRNTVAEQEQHDMGVVCDSFIYRSRTYDGNNYVVYNTDYLPRVVYNYWNVGDAKNDYLPQFENKGELTGELQYLVPGDVVHFTKHIGIVRSIEYSNGKKTDVDKVLIIHSTTWGRIWKVRNEQTLIDFLGEDDCKLGRMKGN